MFLLIDYREKSFINHIQEHYLDGKILNDTVQECTINNIPLKYKITNLQVGDFILKNNELDENISLIIERKSIKDLCASITDGRFRQQKERLYESVQDCDKITFIIEGSKKCISNGTQNMLSHTIIDSSILNLLYKHKYKVICTENDLDTFTNILLLYKKMSSNEFEAAIKPTQPIKLISKSDKIKDNFMAAQLCTIPGLSYPTALIISKTYNNMKSLIECYLNCETIENKYSMLANIQINDKRKLGNAMSKKIYQALCE